MVTWQNRHIIGRVEPVARKAVSKPWSKVAPPTTGIVVRSWVVFVTRDALLKDKRSRRPKNNQRRINHSAMVP